MTLKQLHRVLNEYDQLLDKHLLGGEPERCSAMGDPSPDTYSQQQHLRWMCREVLGFLPHHKIGEPVPELAETQAAMEKAMRWLGFIQGVLWSTGVRTIDQMREDNVRLA